MLVISKTKALELIKKTDGKFFSILFTKKSGEDRYLTGRTGVHKNLKGKGLNYRPEDHGLLCVFDIHKNGYRMISTDNIKSIQVDGKVYSIAG